MTLWWATCSSATILVSFVDDKIPHARGRRSVALCALMIDAPDSSCLSRVSAELRGCNRKRFSSAASFKKEEDPVIRGGRVGPHCRNCGVEQSAAV